MTSPQPRSKTYSTPKPTTVRGTICSGSSGCGFEMITTEVEAEIKAFVKERDEMLLACDVDLMLAFHKKHSPNIPPPSSREVVEASIHKARTAAKSLPMAARSVSKRWLQERGMSSLDEGDVPL